MSEKTVTFESNDGVGFITLDRPPANSYEINFMRDLDAAIDAAIGDAGTKAVIVKSASEKFFSAGADIKAFTSNPTDANMEMVGVAHGALGKMAKSDKMFIALIQGHALGGGFEMALACDFRFGAEGKYRVGLPEVTLGLLPGNGGTQRLSRLVGPNKALELMVGGDALLPEDAHKLGMINKIFSAESAHDETVKYASRLAKGPTLAIGNIKKSVYQGITMSLDEGLALERQLVEPLFNSKDGQEGLTAFVEKRKAEFYGE